MKRIETFLFVGALASALWLGACGDDEAELTCDDLCDKAAECGDDRSECLADCEESNPPQEFLACAVDLKCDPSDEEVFACVREIPPNEACSSGCAKLIACWGDAPKPEEDEWLMDAQTCASFCTWQFPKEAQDCLAEMDEECRVSEECSQHF